ncbi:FAD-dependent oxidoreductase, partial [Burkholderia lata]
MKQERLSVDVAIVGAGPAGLSAARAAARSGATVAIVDDNPRAGGQIWRQGAAA